MNGQVKKCALLRGVVLVLALATAGCSRTSGGQRVTLIIEGGIVVTSDGGGRVLNPGSVAIQGTDIVAIDTPDRISSDYSSVSVINAAGDIVMPGLVNTHTHAPMVLYRGLADDLALMDWLQRYIFPAEAKTVSREFVKIGTNLAALEMIHSGTTTFADMYYFEEEIASATKAAGLRGVLGQTIIQFPVADAKTPAEGLRRTEDFIRAWKGDALVVPAVAPHAMYTNDRETLIAARDLARRYGVPVLIHLAETKDEIKTSQERHQMSPTAYLESLGFWGSNVVGAHGVWLSDEDIATLQRQHVAISHNPESNMKLASGIAPVPKLMAAGVTVALGTDGAASNNDLDMFEAMRSAAFLHKLASDDPRAIPAPVALRMATIEGAKALGLGDRIGSLEPGKKADLIVVSTSGARQTPMYDPISHLVYVAKGTDVKTTIVNGRILMRDGRVTTLDEPRVLSDAKKMAERVREAVAGGR